MAIRLVLTGGDVWRESAEPWLRGVEAWRDPRPTVVLTPDRAQGFYLRSRLVENKRAVLGVRFWTPSDARGFLQGALCPRQRAAPQDEQALIARACAEKLLRGRAAGEDEATLRSVAQEPQSFLRAYELLLGAGWEPSRDGAPYGRRLATEFASTLNQAGLTTQAGLHRLLREAVPPNPRPLARVLLLGFNAAHWPLWDLLQAVCRMADETEVALDHPGEFGKALDELWINSWESFAGSLYEVGEAPEPGPFEALAKSYEEGAPAPAENAELHFLATADLRDQVRAVTLQTLDYLRRPDCARLGLVFPEADALALGVAAQLRELGVPVNDSLGAFQPGPFEARPWQTWLELQEEPTVRRLIAWLRAAEAAGLETGLPSLTAERAARLLDRALGDAMVDDLDFLAAQFDPKETEPRILADFLAKRLVLAEEGTVAGYLTTVQAALRRLGWTDLLSRLPETAPTGADTLPISRRGFLAWLREVADSRERVRPDGNHFYGRVHLLVYSQIAGQAWSHLVLTGLNEGVWPRLFETGAFGSRYELSELNARGRTLNRRGTRQGEQGDGQEIVTPGQGHCLLPLERHDLALRDLGRALRATRGAICLAARTMQEGRNVLPSDFFSHAWQVKTGQVLDDAMFRDLAEKTSRRVREHAPLFPTAAVEPQSIQATSLAHQARRNPAVPFGRYEFAFTQPPVAPVQLPCKEWETAFAHPASVWLAHVVGVGAWPEGRLSWKLSLGTWTHRWLSQALGTPDAPEELESRVRAAAERDWRGVQKRAHDAGLDLYPWWRQMWAQARSVASGLAKGLVPELAGRKALTEIRLPRTLAVALPGAAQADFEVRGRVDLVLVEPATTTASADLPDFTGCRAWVIDFKTGSDSGLTERRLQKGQGLQIALYGLGLRALGAETVTLSVLTPGAELKRQLGHETVLAMQEPFRTIDAIHRRGVFGQSPAEDREHGFAPDYPMTTRAIAHDVLQAKWAIEHGGEGA
jgi:hypothetical protein